MSEAGQGAGEEGEDRQGERQRDAVAHVVDAGDDPLAELVVAVEEPVAEASDDLRCRGGHRHGLVGLGVADDGDAVAAFHDQADEPPEGHADGQQPGAPHRAQGLPERHLPLDPDGEGDPEDRADADEDDRGEVGAADGQRHQGERGRIAPPADPDGPGEEGDEPGQAGPRQQDHGDAGRVVQDVGAQGVGQGGHDHARVPPGRRGGLLVVVTGRSVGPTEGAQQVEDAGARGEHEAAQPQALGQPVGHADGVEEPVEGPHRPQVADDLVGHPAQAHAGVPEEGGVPQETARVQVQVGLRVRADLARLGEDQGQVGDCRQEQQRDAAA